MKKYKIESNEVILLKDTVTLSENKDVLQMTLTTQKIILEKEEEKGIFKKQNKRKVIKIIPLKDIKIYDGKVQIKRQNTVAYIQTLNNNIEITFKDMFKANKFVNKIVNTITGTTRMSRGVKKINNAIDTVDNVLGIDTRDTIKGVIGITVLTGNKLRGKK